MKDFMDDFSLYGTTFDSCLNYLAKVLQRCEDTKLVLNWKKCHFMGGSYLRLYYLKLRALRLIKQKWR